MGKWELGFSIPTLSQPIPKRVGQINGCFVRVFRDFPIFPVYKGYFPTLELLKRKLPLWKKEKALSQKRRIKMEMDVFAETEKAIYTTKEGIGFYKTRSNGETYKSDYFFEWSRCDSIPKTLRWARHMMGKIWVTTEHLRQMIDAIESHHNLKF